MSKKNPNKKPRNYIFSRGKERERLLQEERIAEEKRRKRSEAAKKGSAKGKATREFKEIKKALDTHAKNDRTFYATMDKPPSSLDELKKEIERMKAELKAIGKETRDEAEEASSESERKRLTVRAKLDETWGKELDRLKKKLSEIHEKDKDSRTEEDYDDFWDEEDTAEDNNEDPEIPIDVMTDEDFPF